MAWCRGCFGRSRGAPASQSGLLFQQEVTTHRPDELTTVVAEAMPSHITSGRLGLELQGTPIVQVAAVKDPAEGIQTMRI